LSLTTTGTYGKYFQWLDEDGATGILPIDKGKWIMDHYADGWYDLQGRKLSGKPTQKGIYIYKGKKQIIK
jgi:hypothetical protein